MKTLLLCGGIGKRMLPLTEDKFLYKFLGKTLLEHQFDLLLKTGLTNVILVCNPQNVGKVESIVHHIPGINVEIAIQREPRGIANALKSAASLFNGELLIINPNDVFELSALTGLINACRDATADCYLTGYRVDKYFPGGYLVTDEKGILTRIIEKPGEGNEPSDLVNLLVHLHSRPDLLMEYIGRVKTDRDDAYEQALDTMCHDNTKIMVVPYSGAWHAIKYPWQILELTRFFLERADKSTAPTAQISERAVIEGKVIIEDNVRIMENAVVKGPVYLGKGTVVGNNVLIRAYSHIGSHCVIGFGTEIKGSYIDDGCWFHMNYAGDSVIGPQCNFGAGTVTANWRFDEKPVPVRVNHEVINTGIDKLGAIIGANCRFGINVSIMPGVKIASGTVISPATCVARDVSPMITADIGV